tara:strand:- start:211 stop:459 length:249 start_codon:yes stop_codon:yes gene_type:complete
MASVEIHIKEDRVQKIEGQDVYVIIHDHDTKQTTTIPFKKQEEHIEDSKNTGLRKPITMENKLSNNFPPIRDQHSCDEPYEL